MSLFLCNLLDIGLLDLQFIEKYYNLVRNKVDFTELRTVPLEQINANVILYHIFWQVNAEVFNIIKNHGDLPHDKKEQIISICEKRIAEFSPFLNCIDSWFNNEIDEVNVEGKWITEIANETYFLLLENM